jgi:predicted nucleic acid-binding protein
MIDTDVLIWFMRGNLRALTAINENKNFSVSAVTYMELAQGVRNKNELMKLRAFFRKQEAPILSITEEITAKAISFVEQYTLPHSVRMADALIAATAIVHGLPLLAGNTKHFSVIRGVEVMNFKAQ